VAEETELQMQQEETGSAGAQKKVELDLDDAPFLQTEEKATPPAPFDEQLPVTPDDGAAEEAARKRKKKRLIVMAACGVLVLVTAAVWWFFFRTPPPPPSEGPKPEVIVVPTPAPGAQDNDIVREFATFVVPGKDSHGRTDFLICKFAAITHDPNIQREIERQLVPLRDAIYYYLRSKDRDFISDARNGAEIKKELLSVFNDYLTQGKVEDIVFESYLSR